METAPLLDLSKKTIFCDVIDFLMEANPFVFIAANLWNFCDLFGFSWDVFLANILGKILAFLKSIFGILGYLKPIMGFFGRETP